MQVCLTLKSQLKLIPIQLVLSPHSQSHAIIKLFAENFLNVCSKIGNKLAAAIMVANSKYQVLPYNTCSISARQATDKPKIFSEKCENRLIPFINWVSHTILSRHPIQTINFLMNLTIHNLTLETLSHLTVSQPNTVNSCSVSGN